MQELLVLVVKVLFKDNGVDDVGSDTLEKEGEVRGPP